jgi:hypothetical protein
VVRSVLYLPAEDRLREGGAELIDVWEREPDSSIWVAFEGEPLVPSAPCWLEGSASTGWP